MTVLLKLIKPIKNLDSWISSKVGEIRTKIFLYRGANTCVFCGAKNIHFKQFEAEGTVAFTDGSTRRMLLHWWKNPSCVCPDCALKQIELAFSGPIKTDHDGLHLGECQFTGQKNVPVIGIIWANKVDFNLRFGGGWWNGHTACFDAFRQAITSCKMHSSIMTCTDKGIKYCSGHHLLDKQTYEQWKDSQ